MARIVNHTHQYEPLDFSRLTLPRRRNQMLSPVPRTPKFPLSGNNNPSPSPLPNLSCLNLETPKLIPPLHPIHSYPYDKHLRPPSRTAKIYPDKINELNSPSTSESNVWLPKTPYSSYTFQPKSETPNQKLVMNNIKPVNWVHLGNHSNTGNTSSGHVRFSSVSSSVISDCGVSCSPLPPVFRNLPGIQETAHIPDKMLNNQKVSVGCDMQDNLLEAIIAEAKLKAELSVKNSGFRNSLPPFFDHQPPPLQHSALKNIVKSIDGDTDFQHVPNLFPPNAHFPPSLCQRSPSACSSSSNSSSVLVSRSTQTLQSTADDTLTGRTPGRKKPSVRIGETIYMSNNDSSITQGTSICFNCDFCKLRRNKFKKQLKHDCMMPSYPSLPKKLVFLLTCSKEYPKIVEKFHKMKKKHPGCHLYNYPVSCKELLWHLKTQLGGASHKRIVFQGEGKDGFLHFLFKDSPNVTIPFSIGYSTHGLNKASKMSQDTYCMIELFGDVRQRSIVTDVSTGVWCQPSFPLVIYEHLFPSPVSHLIKGTNIPNHTMLAHALSSIINKHASQFTGGGMCRSSSESTCDTIK